jgi:hypothetical protein
VIDNENGSYTIPYRLTVAGLYDAVINVGGHNIDSEVKIDVQPNELSPIHAIAIGAGVRVHTSPPCSSFPNTGLGIKKAKAGEEAKFMVQSLDKYKNEIQTGGAEVCE